MTAPAPCCCLGSNCCCCPTYKAEDENEGVFQFCGWCTGSAYMGCKLIILAIILFIVFMFLINIIGTRAVLYAPAGLFAFGGLFIIFAGGEWLVINVKKDEIFLSKGYFFNIIKRRVEIGRLSNVVNISLNYRVIAYYHQITRVATSINFEFPHGKVVTVAQQSYRKRVDIAYDIRTWLDAHYTGHKIQYGHDDDVPPVHIDALIITPNTPLLSNNSELEQELRALIVRFQMGTNNDSQSDGKKLALAMEYNPNSLLNTYLVLKQQNPVINKQAERILINTAQTIIEAKNSVAPAAAAASDALSEEEGFN